MCAGGSGGACHLCPIGGRGQHSCSNAGAQGSGRPPALRLCGQRSAATPGLHTRHALHGLVCPASERLTCHMLGRFGRQKASMHGYVLLACSFGRQTGQACGLLRASAPCGVLGASSSEAHASKKSKACTAYASAEFPAHLAIVLHTHSLKPICSTFLHSGQLACLFNVLLFALLPLLIHLVQHWQRNICQSALHMLAGS